MLKVMGEIKTKAKKENNLPLFKMIRDHPDLFIVKIKRAYKELQD